MEPSLFKFKVIATNLFAKKSKNNVIVSRFNVLSCTSTVVVEKTNNSFPGCWTSIENQRIHFKQLGIKLNIQKPEDWYSVPTSKFPSALYRKYDSVCTMFENIYPEYTWYPWKFSRCGGGFWKSKENQKKYFKYLEKKLNVTSTEDWYRISSKNFESKLRMQFKSMLHMFQTMYPNHIWLVWRFSQVKSHWYGKTGKLHRRLHMDHATKVLNLYFPENWYSVQSIEVYRNVYAEFWKKEYKSHLSNCLCDLFPEINWLPWRFVRVPTGFWEHRNNVLQFLNWCEIQLDLKSKYDWHFVTIDQLRKLGGTSLISVWANLSSILKHYYPQEKWDITKFTTTKISTKEQFKLVTTIQNMLPEEIIYQNFKHPDLFFEDTKKKIELDIYLPSFNLAFQYESAETFIDIKSQTVTEHKEITNNSFITLIEIPFTWNENPESLSKMIHKVRPDIVLS